MNYSRKEALSLPWSHQTLWEIPRLDNQKTTEWDKIRRQREGEKPNKHKLFLTSDTQMRGGAASRGFGEIIHADTVSFGENSSITAPLADVSFLVFNLHLSSEGLSSCLLLHSLTYRHVPPKSGRFE